jgi:uncharacterized protein
MDKERETPKEWTETMDSSLQVVELDDLDQAQLKRLSQGLGKPINPLNRRRAGKEAGKEAGMWFYDVPLGKIDLALREDGMRACLVGISPDITRVSQISELLKNCNLTNVKIPSAQKVKEAMQQTPMQWLLLAEGGHTIGAKLMEYGNPDIADGHLPADTLILQSRELGKMRLADQIEPAPDSHVVPVMPGDIVAHIREAAESQTGRDVFGRALTGGGAPAEFPAVGPHIDLEGDVYRASRYGYLSLLDNTLSVVSPLWVDPTAMEVHWCVLDGQRRGITRGMLQPWLDEFGVVEGIRHEDIERFLTQTDEKPQRHYFLIAAGIPPEDGKDAQVDILVDLERKAGKERDDGSIDFREVNFIPDVKKGQMVVRLAPAIKGRAGRDIRGKDHPAVDGEKRMLRVGDNVRVEIQNGVEQFYSTIEGMLKITDDEVSVVELLTIDGDVGFHTGNLQFGGEIYIKGSVIQSFSVKAEGDITVGGSVENMVTLVSGGNITVGKGIVGRKTKVAARGAVRAQFVQNATVQSGQDLTLGNYAFHGILHSDGKIRVCNGSGNRGGSVIGGQIWGLKGIEVYWAGSPSGPLTVLSAGLDPKQADVSNRLEHNIEESSKQIRRLLARFSLDHVEVEQIRKMIAASSGPQKKLFAHYAHQLGEIIQKHQKALTVRKRLEKAVSKDLDKTAIRIWKNIHPGVTIRLGEYLLKIEDEIVSPRYHIAGGQLLER